MKDCVLAMFPAVKRKKFLASIGAETLTSILINLVIGSWSELTGGKAKVTGLPIFLYSFNL